MSQIIYFSILILLSLNLQAIKGEDSIPNWVVTSEMNPQVTEPISASSKRRLSTLRLESNSASNSTGEFNYTLLPESLPSVKVYPENGFFPTVAGIFIEAQGSQICTKEEAFVQYSVNAPLSADSPYFLEGGIVTISSYGSATLGEK